MLSDVYGSIDTNRNIGSTAARQVHRGIHPARMSESWDNFPDFGVRVQSPPLGYSGSKRAVK